MLSHVVRDVVRWANDGEYRLGSSVWTTDINHGLAVARQIEAGSTFINSHEFEALELRMPFGGVGARTWT